MKDDYVSKLKSVATGKNVLVFLIPASVIYLVMLLYTIPDVKQYALEMEIFDMSPAGYSYEYAMQLLGELGVAGRDSYLYKQLPLDFIYPALFAMSSCLLMAWVFSKGKALAPGMYYLCLVPIVAGFLDYLENIQVILMIFNYPNVSENQVAMASLTTIAKSGLTTIFFVILVVGFIRVALVQRTG
ncbi:MAG: hypothetical protein P8Y28_05780 [Gammaproteobacteria bacterium]|jgi:hypothetical protein